jgi:hypothetical protein
MGTGIALDGSGNAYVTGWTSSANFPTTAGAFQTTNGGGGGDVFVAKFNPSLSGPASLVYSTYLGGSGQDGYASDSPYYLVTYNTGPGIAVDSSGDAYVAGQTTSSNFPTTAGAFQTKYNGPKTTNGTSGDGFVTKLNATGTALVYSTYLGGRSYDGAAAIAVDSSGDAHVTGWTLSTDFPTLNPIQASKKKGNDVNGQPNSDVFVSTLNSTGSGLLFSTYLGGTNDDYGFGIALDSSGNDYVTGQTLSSNFPTTAGAPLTSGGGFVFKISASPSGPAAPVAGSPSTSSPAVAAGVTRLSVQGSTAARDEVFAHGADPGLLQAFDILLADQGDSLPQDPVRERHRSS